MKTDREQHEQNRMNSTEKNSFVQYKSYENTCNKILLSHKKMSTSFVGSFIYQVII